MTAPPSEPGLAAAYLLARVDEVSYLSAIKFDRYRPLVRYLLDQYEMQKAWSNSNDLHAAMCRLLADPAYSAVDFANDLRQLVEWRVLDEMHDSSRLTSLKDLTNRRTRYRLSQRAVDVERLVREWEDSKGSGVRLEADRLQRAVASLREVLELLPVGRSHLVLAVSELTSLHGSWEAFLASFDLYAQQANAYLHLLATDRPPDLENLEAFLRFRESLVLHLESFVGQAAHHAQQMVSLLTLLATTGHDAVLLEALTYYRTTVSVSADGPEDPEVVRAQLSGALRRVAMWFAPNGGQEGVRSGTVQNIQLVVDQNLSLVLRSQVGASRQTDLLAWAKAFRACDSMAEAHVLGARAFGCPTVRHLFGNASVNPRDDSASVWTQVTHDVLLFPIRRGRQPEAPLRPVRDRAAERAALMMQRNAESRRLRALWAALFANGPVATDGLALDDLTLADLLHVIGACRASSDRLHSSRDGSTFKLTEPTPDLPDGLVTTPSGRLRLRPYIISLVGQSAPAPALSLPEDLEAAHE